MLLATPCRINAALEVGLPEMLCGTYADIHESIAHFAAQTGDHDAVGNFTDHAKTLIAFVKHRLGHIGDLHDAAALFNARFANALDRAAERAAIMDFAERLGADAAQLERDRKAFDRFFDGDAVSERYRRRVGEAERELAHTVERLGLVAGEALRVGEMAGDDELLSKAIAGVLTDARSYRGDARVKQAGFRALHHIGTGALEPLTGFWIDIAIRDTRRLALDTSEDTWAQCDAFATLLTMAPGSLEPVLERRLGKSSLEGPPLRQENRMFVRRYLADLLCEAVPDHPKLSKYLSRIANDRNGAVRQALAKALVKLPRDEAKPLVSRLRIDQDPQVRAMLFAQPQAMAQTIGGAMYRSHIIRVLSRDEDTHVLRMAMDAAVKLVAWQGGHEPAQQAESVTQLRQALSVLRARSTAANRRRWAGEAMERIWLYSDADALDMAEYIRFQMAATAEGQRRKLPELADVAKSDPHFIGRIMAVLAQDGFGLELIAGSVPRMQKGERFARRLWRILFELRVSSTDKRQAFLHTIGRSLPGTISAPAAHMAELAPTKVPGEPLHFADEGGWRNYLPLVDHALAAIDRGKTTRIFTSEGVTSLTAPSGVLARITAYWQVSRNFARLAALRNQGGSSDYVDALRQYGLSVEFQAHDAYEAPLLTPQKQTALKFDQPQTASDPEVVRLFDLGGVLIAVPVLLKSAAAYFATVFANTLGQLALFLLLAGGWFVGRHLYLGYKARRYRNAIPLSLGGWGTRGKSGTERLKAGLINALGHPLVSKTTGCEAMFLRGEPFGGLTEMFLFRPYDKATIWEQFNLIRISVGLKARVFLWECMGLNPSYVRVLQRDWMRDNIGTITNTYPDHEDVQGPAGRNIPEVMREFIPENSVLLTTEEEMLPILREGAAQANTRMRAIDWREAGLVHENLLARFPYAEHPYNIALVAAMGDELGLGEDFCIREMSDRVVADLGVLKIYPQANVDGRILEFVMGMSANERFGAMGNWDRMGFADHDLGEDPAIYVSTVVNNRADRVPRSQVFARLLVNDISADKHFLIGSNIDGLIGFIEEEWEAYAARLSLESDTDDTPAEIFERLARQQRVPLNQEQIERRLMAMLTAIADNERANTLVRAAREGQLAASFTDDERALGEQISEEHAEMVKSLEEYQALSSVISKGGAAEHLARVRAFLHAAFMRKLVPVRDVHMSGENIVRLIAHHSPPGLTNRIMGMQNIKGTGLDFVYRWQAWEQVHRACAQARDADPMVAEKGLSALAGFQEYGILSGSEVRRTIAELQIRDELPVSFTPAQLDAIIARVDTQLGELDAAARMDGEEAGSASIPSRFAGRVVEIVEAFVDAGDAVRRRRQADAIYKAMIAEQISSQRAALELKKLTMRQKGGWLAESITQGQGRFASLFRRSA